MTFDLVMIRVRIKISLLIYCVTVSLVTLPKITALLCHSAYIIIIINEFHRDASLKENFRAHRYIIVNGNCNPNGMSR